MVAPLRCALPQYGGGFKFEVQHRLNRRILLVRGIAIFAQNALSAIGLERFNALRDEAVAAVSERFYSTHGSVYVQFGDPGREACREALGYHLEFMRPVLEFGLTQPTVDYLRWLDCVLAEQHMIQPAQYGIGKKWQNNQVTVAQEHLATAIAQSVMTLGLARSELPASNGKQVLLACVEGNNHAVGLQMVADAFQFAGWEVQFLGANVPTDALIRHLDQLKPDLLGLSVAFAQQLYVVREIMAR